MFREIANVRQVEGEPKRRWFVDDELELIVWFENKKIVGFQLCYEKDKESKALTWHKNEGYLHSGIDDGDLWKATPILVPDGVFDEERVEKRFASSSATLPDEIADFVKGKVAQFPKK